MPQALAEVGVHADVFGEQHREAPDPLDVRTGVLVSELDRHRQTLNGLGLRDLQLRESSFQVARAVLDLIFQRCLAVLAHAPPKRERGSSERDQASGHERRRPSEHRTEDCRSCEQPPGQHTKGRVPTLDAPARRPSARVVLRDAKLTHESADPRYRVVCGLGTSTPGLCGSPKKTGLNCAYH